MYVCLWGGGGGGACKRFFPKSFHNCILPPPPPFPSISPFPAILHQHAAASKWEAATRLCRFVKVGGVSDIGSKVGPISPGDLHSDIEWLVVEMYVYSVLKL